VRGWVTAPPRAGLDKVRRVVSELADQRPIVLFNPRLARCRARRGPAF
jgi:hypothetical protein